MPEVYESCRREVQALERVIVPSTGEPGHRGPGLGEPGDDRGLLGRRPAHDHVE